MVETDWTKEFEGISDVDPTALTAKMEEVMENYMSRCFETVTKTTKSTDAPWITSAIRRKIKIRKGVFKKKG